MKEYNFKGVNDNATRNALKVIVGLDIITLLLIIATEYKIV